MYAKAWVPFLALPACLLTVCAQREYGAAPFEDDAIYNSGFTDTQEVLGAVPCPDYTRYATVRQ